MVKKRLSEAEVVPRICIIAILQQRKRRKKSSACEVIITHRSREWNLQ